MRDNLSEIDVFILCGGLGTRLRAVSKGVPKSMVEINKHPFLNIIITYLASFGFKRFILGIGYKADYIVDYYKNYKIPGIDILFSRENIILGTGGAVSNSRKLLRRDNLPFLVLNGDSFCKFNPLEFLSFHKQKKASISILLRKVSRCEDYGSIKIDKNYRILSFCEKSSSLKSGWINSGVYLFEKKIFSLMPKKRKFSLETDFFPSILNKKCFGFVYNKLFIDIGTPQRYLKARSLFNRNNPVLDKPN